MLVAAIAVVGFGVEILRTDPPALVANFLSSSSLGNETDALARNGPASVRIRRDAMELSSQIPR